MLWRIAAFAALGGFLFGCARLRQSRCTDCTYLCVLSVAVAPQGPSRLSSSPTAGCRSQIIRALACLMRHTCVKPQTKEALMPHSYDLGVMGGALLGISDEMATSDWVEGIIVGAAKLGACFGAFLGGALMLHYGRRIAITIDSVLFMLGPIVMATSAGATCVPAYGFISSCWCSNLECLFLSLGCWRFGAFCWIAAGICKGCNKGFSGVQWPHLAKAATMFSLARSGLIFGRLLVGLGIGVSAVVVPAYLGEVAPASARGTIVELYEVPDPCGMHWTQRHMRDHTQIRLLWDIWIGVPSASAGQCRDAESAKLNPPDQAVGINLTQC